MLHWTDSVQPASQSIFPNAISQPTEVMKFSYGDRIGHSLQCSYINLNLNNTFHSTRPSEVDAQGLPWSLNFLTSNPNLLSWASAALVPCAGSNNSSSISQVTSCVVDGFYVRHASARLVKALSKHVSRHTCRMLRSSRPGFRRMPPTARTKD